MEEYYFGKRVANKSFRKHLLWYPGDAVQDGFVKRLAS